MKLIVGIGNPEAKYKNTRHNVGLVIVDELMSSGRIKDIVVKRSDKFMNNSGVFVAKQIKNYKLEIKNLVVVHDDLDIPLGSFKIQFGKGPKGHNGIIDIEEKLGTSDFWRVRVGVENRAQGIGSRVKGEDYVLEDFTEEEKLILNRVIKQICNQLVV